MKKIKKYAMALVAFVIAATSLTLMSFEDKQSLQWYEVDENGAILPTTMPAPSGDCIENFEENICAVRLPSDHTFTNISQAPSAPKAGQVEP